MKFSTLLLGLALSAPAYAQINMHGSSAVGQIAQQATGGVPQWNTPPGYGYYPNQSVPSYSYPAPVYSVPLTPPGPWGRQTWITGPFSSPTIVLPPNYYGYPGTQYYSYPAQQPGYTVYPPAPYPVYVYPGTNYGNYGNYSTQSGNYGVRFGTGSFSVGIGGSKTTTTTRHY